MAKSSGITSTYSLDDSGGTLRDISTAVLSFEISTPRGVFDITGLDKSAIERMLGLAQPECTVRSHGDHWSSYRLADDEFKQCRAYSDHRHQLDTHRHSIG